MKSIARSNWEKTRDIYLFEGGHYPEPHILETGWCKSESQKDRKWFIILLVLLWYRGAWVLWPLILWPRVTREWPGHWELAWLDTMIRKILNVNKQTLRILPGTVQSDSVTHYYLLCLPSSLECLVFYFTTNLSVSQSVDHKLLLVYWTISKCPN